MNDIGFNGSGSRFNARFGSGEEITAKQLNDLATGIQAGLPMPYIGDGPSVSFTSGGTIITTNPYRTKTTPSHPFKISVRTVDDTDYWNIVPGTLNSLIPKGNREYGGSDLITKQPQGDWLVHYTNVGDNKISYIYLEAGPNSGSGFTFPDNNLGGAGYPDVSSYDQAYTDDDASGVLLLALITKSRTTGAITIDQMVTTSMYADRRKFTEPDVAQYYFWQS
jgi:hypothetical protein